MGEIFYEYLSLNYEKYKYSNLIKNQIDRDDDTVFSLVGDSESTSPTDSIYVIDTGNSMSSLTDNRGLKSNSN